MNGRSMSEVEVNDLLSFVTDQRNAALNALAQANAACRAKDRIIEKLMAEKNASCDPSIQTAG